MDPSAFGGAKVKSNAAQTRAKFLARKARANGQQQQQQQQQPAFGASAAPAFGASAAPAFGAAAAAPAFGSGAGAPVFGTSAPASGSAGFGSPASGFGKSAGGAFGAAAAGAFGVKKSSGGFGAGAAAKSGGGGIGGGIGGSTADSSKSPFGSAAAVSGFGKPSTGGSMFAASSIFGKAKPGAAGAFSGATSAAAAFGQAAPAFGAPGPSGKSKPKRSSPGDAAGKAGANGPAARSTAARLKQPTPQQKGQQQQQQKQKQQKQFGKLSVMNLPPEKNNDVRLKKYFGQIGPIVACKCFPKKKGALVMFQKLADAQLATRHAAGYHKSARCKAEPYDPNAKKGASTAGEAAARGAQMTTGTTRPAPTPEKRVDASDGGSYTKAEFVELYGGTAEWDAAAPAASSSPARDRATAKPKPKASILSRLSKGPAGAAAATPEKRTDASDGGSYTKAEFVELYGGTAEWDAAAPKAAAAATQLAAAAPAAFKFGDAQRPTPSDEEAVARAAAIAAAPAFGGGAVAKKQPSMSDEEAAARAAALAATPNFGGSTRGTQPTKFKAQTQDSGSEQNVPFQVQAAIADAKAREAGPTPKNRVVKSACGSGQLVDIGRPEPPPHTFVQAVDNVTVGTCCEMCPEEEVQYVNGEINHKWSSQIGKVGYDLLPCFEGSEMKTISGVPLKHGPFAGEGVFRGQPLRPVKRWRRAAAGVDMPAHELRTPEALIMSLSYICSDVVVDRTVGTVDKALREEYRQWIQRDPPKTPSGEDRKSFDEDQLLLDVYCYASEKLQQIGKDVIGQALVSWEAVEVREQVSRFYIMYMHEMCEDPYWERTAPTYGMKNDLELDAVLGDTKDVHKKMRGRGFHCPNEAEFAGYLLLRSMDSTKVMKMPSDIRTSPEVMFAMRVMEAYKTNDYVAFFRMLRDEATFLQGCMMLKKVSEVRQQGLRILNKTMGTAKLAKQASASTRVPLGEMVRLFAFDNAMNAAEFCSALGYQVREGAVWMKEELVPETDELAKYQDPKTGMWFTVKMQAVEDKKRTKLQCIMRGTSDYARPIGEVPGQAASPRQSAPVAVAMPSKEDIAKQNATRREMEKLKAAIKEKERLVHLRKQQEKAEEEARRKEEQRKAELARQEAERTRLAREQEEARKKAEAEAAARAAEEERQRFLAAEARQREKEAEAKERERLRKLALLERKRREAEEQRRAQIERERKAECARLLKKSLRWWKVCSKLKCWKRERLEAIEARKRYLLRRWTMLEWLKRWYAGAQRLIEIREAKVAESRKFYEALHRKSGKHSNSGKRTRLDSKHLVGRAKVARHGSTQQTSVRLETIRPLNVLDIVGDTLALKNPGARALLWQLVVAADDEHRSQDGHDGWLHAKLAQPQPACPNATGAGSGGEKRLSLGKLASLRAPTSRSRLLSLYQDTLPRPGAETNAQRPPTLSLCCLSLDATLIQQECGEAAEEASPLRLELKGTAGMVFLATVRSDTELEWAAHRQRLRLLLTTVPKAAAVPVLVLLATDVYPRFPDGHVHRVLGLDDGFFTGRVAAFLYHVVRETPNEETHHDFEKCLKWLAEQSPAQPVVKEYELEALVHDSVAHWQDRASWQHQPVARPAAVLATLNDALDNLAASLDAADPTSIWWPSAEFEVLWNAVDDGSCGPEEIPLADWNATELWAEMRGAVDGMLSGLRFPEVQSPGAAGKGSGGAGPLLALTAGSANSAATPEAADFGGDLKVLSDSSENKEMQREDRPLSSFLAQLLQKLGYFRARRRQYGAGGLAREQQAEEELDTGLGMPSGLELVELVDSVRAKVKSCGHGAAWRAVANGELDDMEWRMLVERLHTRRLEWLAATIEQQGLPALALPQKRVELKQPREPLLVVLPHPVLLTVTPTQAARNPPSNARTRSWAQVAASTPLSAAISKRPRASVQYPRHEEAQVVEELSSVLADEKGESEQFEDILASALNASS